MLAGFTTLGIVSAFLIYRKKSVRTIFKLMGIIKHHDPIHAVVDNAIDDVERMVKKIKNKENVEMQMTQRRFTGRLFLKRETSMFPLILMFLVHSR